MASTTDELIGDNNYNKVKQSLKKQIHHRWYNFHGLSPKISILSGSFSMNDKHFKFASRGRQAAPCSIIAVVFGQMFKPKNWTYNHINQILNNGDKLYRISVNRNRISSGEYVTPTMVWPEFFIDDYKCLISVKSSGIYGDLLSESVGCPDIIDGLERFFKLHDCGIITTQGSSVAIWHDSKHGFFYFDPSSCNEKGARISSNGVACLMRFKCMNDMRDLFINNLNKNFDTRYCIDKVSVIRVNLINCSGVIENQITVDKKISTNFNSMQIEEKQISCTKVIPKNAKLIPIDKTIIKEPLSITISNYNIDAKFATMPLVDQNNFNTGYPYYDMQVNIPSTFTELTDNRAILRGWTHEFSDIYKGKGGQNVANCIMSIGMQKVHPVKTWLRPKIDEILALGDSLYAEIKISKSTIKSTNATDFNNTKITIDNKRYYVDVDLLTIVGTLSSKIPSVLNIKQALEEFFLINKDGIIECTSMGVGVWTQNDCYYMFDSRECDAQGIRIIREKSKVRGKGKKKDLAEMKEKIEGKSCVMRFPSIDALVAQFLNNVDPVKKNDRFIIRHIIITDDIPGIRPWCDFQPGESGRTWVLLGNLSKESDELDDYSRGIQGIAMPVVALVNATEIIPNNWTKQTVDDVIRYGDEYYNWCIPRDEENEVKLSLRNLKKNVYVKNRRYKINIQESSVIGNIKATLDGQVPNLTKGITQFFDTHQFGVVDVKDLSVAIWRFDEEHKVKGKSMKDSIKEFSYYCFDPNERGECGQRDIQDDEQTAACVIRALNPVELARRIEMNINENSTESDEFFIHSLKVESISDPMTAEEIEIDKQTPIKPELNSYIEMGDDGAYLNGSFDQSNVMQFKPRTCNKQQAANAMVALAMCQLYNPHLWNREVIDDILKLGDKIIQENMKNLPELVEEDGEETGMEPTRDYLLPNELDESFDIGVNRMTLSMNEAINTRPIGNLIDTLDEFFSANAMGILLQDSVMLPIWKEGNIYFTMDPRGRSHEESKESVNFATVFWFTALSSFADNIQQLLINPNGNIRIEAVRLENEYETRLAENQRPKKTTSTENLWHNFPKKYDGVWELIGDVLMSDERFSIENRGKQNAAVAIIAIIFSKVYEPRQWTKEIIDEVIITGDKLHEKSIARLGKNILLRVHQILPEFFLSNRRLNFKIKDCVQSGVINGRLPKILDLKSGLENFFEDNISGVVTLANDLNIAIWKNNNYYYCLLPNIAPLGDHVSEVRPRVLRFATTDLITDNLSVFVNSNDDYEIHGVDILDWNKLPSWKFDPSSAIRPSNLPPLNAYKQLECGVARAILRGGIHQGSSIFLETMKNRQTAANCVVALGMSVIKNPVTWTKKTLDDILVIGCKVHYESLKARRKKDELKPPDVIRIFRVGVNILTADVDESTVTGQVAIPPHDPEVKGKKKAKVKKSSKAKGKKKKQRRESQQPSPPLPSILLEEGLKNFFENNHAGILVAGRFMIAIWKDKGVYFMYDPHARNDQGLVEEDGVACTIWFACIEPFFELIFNNIDETDKFGNYVICRAIIRTNIIQPLPCPVGFQPFFDSAAPPDSNSWTKKILTVDLETLSEYYYVDDELSVLSGTIHMRNIIFDSTNRGLQSTAIAAIAIVVGVLHVPSTWTPQLVNSILKYGDILHSDSVRMSRSGHRTLSPSELLTVFIVGDFKTIIHIHRYTTAGILLMHDLAQALTLFFQNNCAGILHTPNLAVAVMQHYGKFYLFDPCECDKFGNSSFEGAACVAKCDNVMRLAQLFVTNCNYKVPCVYTINAVNILNLQFFSDTNAKFAAKCDE